MNVKDICVSIKNNEILNFSQSQFNNSNKIITFIDAWAPPYIYKHDSQVCGPIIKIVEQLCKQYGYK